MDNLQKEKYAVMQELLTTLGEIQSTRGTAPIEISIGQGGDGEHSNQFEVEPIAYERSGEVWGYRVLSGNIIETKQEQQEREEKQRIYESTERAVTLTNGQWSKLETYLLMSTKYRQGEAETWEEIAKERKENGELKFKNAPSNAAFWQEIIKTMEIIKDEISKSN